MSAKESYTYKDIKVLEEIEHIQKNAGMYIGEHINPNHLIYEILDNALDESQAGFASIVGIEINNTDHIVTVADNGRGIPYKHDTILTLATKLFSGGKFNKKEGGSYGIASGLHGIGIVAVTALSDWLEISVYRDDKHIVYRFEDAKCVKSEITDHKGKGPHSTQMMFKPSSKYFDTLIFEDEPIRNRMKIASVHIDKLRLYLAVDDKSEVIKCCVNQYFNEDILNKPTEKEKENLTFAIQYEAKLKDERLKVKFCWDFNGSTTPKTKGCVNLLSVDNGTHVNRFYEVIKDVIEEFAKKEKVKFNKQDALVGLRAFVSLMIYEPEYDSQTKNRLTTKKADFDYLYADVANQFRESLKNNASMKNTLLDFFATYRRRLNSKGNIIKGNSTVSRLNQSLDSKLRDCTSHNVDMSELFILEGTSASGSLIKCRDPKYHAVLGLKGKIPNVADDKKEFYKNKEILEIVNALGTGVEPDYTESSLRYGKIIITTDADSDGSHIAVLLMVLFLKLTPKLIEKGMLYRAIMPLYGAMVKKKFIPFYTDEELSVFKKSNPSVSIQRYKGLGEMNPEQLHPCVIDPSTRRLERIEFPDDPDGIFRLLTDPRLKRNLV